MTNIANDGMNSNGKFLGSVTLDNLAGAAKVPASVRGPNVEVEVHPNGDGLRLDFYRRKNGDAPQHSATHSTPEYSYGAAVEAVREAMNRTYGL